MSEVELLAKHHKGFEPPHFEPVIVLPSSEGSGFALSEDLGRPYRWMEKRPRKPQRDRNPPGKRPSEIARKDGVLIGKAFGLMACPSRRAKLPRELYDLHRPLWRRDSARSNTPTCGYLLIFRRGNKTVRCQKCGCRIWLAGVTLREVIIEHDNLNILREAIQLFRGWRGRHPSASLSTQLFHRWGRRVEEKMAMETFYSHLPWHLENFSGVAHG